MVASKTDDSGNATTLPSVYTYSRTLDDVALTETDSVTYPNSLQVVTVSDNEPSSFSYGKVLSSIYKDGAGTTLRQMDYTYLTAAGGGIQLASVVTTDDAGQKAKVAYDYGSWGRLANVYEYGFKAGSYTVKRRTLYQYSDDAGEIGVNLLRLVTEVDVYDALADNDNTNDVLKAKTVYSYDNYAVEGGMEYYALTSSSYPPNHDSSFDQNNTTRGNVTGVQTFSSISPSVSTTRHTKWDIFGNIVQADVSCCQVKNISFNSSNYYSQPMSETSGTPNATPYLTTSYQYDFNTGVMNSVIDPNGQLTSFGYDSAWRLLTANASSLATASTKFDKDSNGNDQLSYTQQVTYKEKDTDPDSAKKTITSKSWFDGAGRVLRSGNETDSSPTTFDTVATVYDSMGRVLKQSNPYTGDPSGNGSPSYWTSNVYDALSRVKEVDLPDDNPSGQRSRIQTGYSGPSVTVTDQVGRQRKSEVDGLGRLTKVTEQDTTSGALGWETTYSYDLLDNLTQVNQGGQIRSFSYDALSRMMSQTTPEGQTVSFTYTDFSAVLKRTDARTVETHYQYDSLNRPSRVWYTGFGGNDDGTFRPILPSGVDATADVTITYNNFTTAQAGNGQVHQITDGVGSETYAYDSLGRVSSKTRAIDSVNYQTQYQYNQANQLTVLIYPSGKRVRTNHDTRGRMNGLDKIDSAGNLLSSYLTSVGYNTAGQVTSTALANGVSEAYGYSADRLQLTSQSATKGRSTLMSMSYSYQAATGDSGASTTAGDSGQLMSITGSIDGGPSLGLQDLSEVFQYDNVGRLVYASGVEPGSQSPVPLSHRAKSADVCAGCVSSNWNRKYDYDRWGNRTTVWTMSIDRFGNSLWCRQQDAAYNHDAGGAPTTNRTATLQTYPSCDEVSGFSYQYDAAGNEISGDSASGLLTCSYDGESRLTSVVVSSSGGQRGTNNSYDAANRRLKKISAGGAVTHYIWEGNQVIAEYNGTTGALLREYVYAGSRMLAKDEGGGTGYFHQDRLSTRMMTDGNGNLTTLMSHFPFGEDTNDSMQLGTLPEKHQFTSYERDYESGTDYAVNRQYHTANGRFMQVDPIAGRLSDPQRLNRYAYTSNDPINFIDPLGLDKECFDGDGKKVDCNSPSAIHDNGDESDPVVLQASYDDYLLGPAWTRWSYVHLQLDTGKSTERPQRSANRDANAISGMLNICGAASSYGQYSSVSNGMWRSTLNGKSYPLSWGGNGATGARSLVMDNAGAFRLLGKAAGVLGMGFSFTQGYQSYRQGDNAGAAKSGLDLVMGGVGTFGGPYGAAASTIYFGVDMTVGWHPLIQDAEKRGPSQCVVNSGVWLPLVR